MLVSSLEGESLSGFFATRSLAPANSGTSEDPDTISATVRGGLYGSSSSWRMAPAAGAAWRTAAMTNALKRLCGSRELKLGHFLIEFATPGIGHILKGAGCDFVFIDMEHSGFSFETVKSALRYCEAARLPAIVRVPSKSYHHIARAADIGAEAVMVPMVDTDAEARELVSHLKYTPLGARGVALGIAHDISGAPARCMSGSPPQTSGPACSRSSRPPPGS